MRKCDIAVCIMTILIGVAWFAAAEIVYDGSMMEDPFLRSGMLAQFYVPLATMYLIKAIKGNSAAVTVCAAFAAFFAFMAMEAVNIWVTHYKPGCDHCHLELGECATASSLMAFIYIFSVSVSDAISARLVGKMKFPIMRLFVVRRFLRLLAMLVFTCVTCVATYFIVGVILRIAWCICQVVK